MEFNSFTWGLYRHSEEYREIAGSYESLMADLNAESLDQALRTIKRYNPVLQISLDDEHDYAGTIDYIKKLILPWIDDVNETESMTPFQLFEHMVDSGAILTTVDGHESVILGPNMIVDAVADIDMYSIALALRFPESFVPYFYFGAYFVVQEVFDHFGIPLQPVPKRQDYQKRLLHYNSICAGLKDFGSQWSFAPADRYAFLYGFAPHYLPAFFAPDDLPQASRAFFVGVGINSTGDFEYLDAADDSTVFRWQGNKDSFRGDIVVMYCLSPRSEIHSVWRTVSPGFLDPFFAFYNSVFIGFPVRVPPLHVSDIRNDDVLKAHPLVRSNMQGINGRLIESEYYERVCELLIDRGADRSILPTLIGPAFAHNGTFDNERDVELHLLEPLLAEIGIDSNRWKRQVPLRMGRGFRIYPDYLVDAKQVGGDWRAKAVVEAKYRVQNDSSFRKDIRQAISYALRVEAECALLVALEGVWAVRRSDGFDPAKAQKWSWSEINSPDGIAEVRYLLSQ